MDYRKRKLFSWKKGYDIMDNRDPEYKKIVAKRIRKQEKRNLKKES